ncbi:outer envelope pore 24B-like protein [Wolffia australiana]
MAKATLKGKYEAEKNTGSAVASVAFFAGDVKLKASVTDETVAKGPSLNGLLLSVEKPGTFIFDCDVPRKDFRFQFMNTIRVMEKPVNLTYIHFHGANRTTLDGTLTVDPANKLSCSYAFQTSNCRVKYAYAHGSLRRTVFEPCYDFSKKAWDFSLSRKFEGDDLLRASYETSRKNLKLEWSRDSKVNGIFKIAAAVDLAEEQKKPKLTAETTWNFDLL